LHNHNRIRRKCFGMCSVSLGVGHIHGKLPQLMMGKRRKLKRLARKQCC
jgi:hypothetical protein